MWSRLIGIAIVLLLVAGAAWALWPRPLNVETATIERRDLVVTIEEEGETRIREVYRVAAPIAGRLTRVTMHVGDDVIAGQTVASLLPAGPGLLDERSRRIATAAADAAAAAVAMAEANLAQARAHLDFATAESERTSALADRALVSTRVEQQATLEATTAAQAVTAAEAALLMRQQELESARAALIEGEGDSASSECCTDIRAPASGRILTVLTESEQVVQPGTPIMEIGDPTDLEVVVEVLSSDAVRLTEGADATIERWGGDPLHAAVRRIDPVAVTRVSALGVEEQRAQVILDFVDGPEVRPRLGHGFRIVARIAVWRGADLVTVPLGALFRRGEAWAVFTVEDGRARLRTVQLGQRTEQFAEVLDGLAAGDTVIVHPGDTVEDQSAVTPIVVAEAAAAP